MNARIWPEPERSNRHTVSRRERRRADPPARPKPRPADKSGCTCDSGPTIVATWRRGQVSVALEHWSYCAMPSVAMDPDEYADFGRRVPIPPEATV